MKILFVMYYPGYLRYFDSVVRLLVERGHTVCLAWEQPRKQSEGAEALAGLGQGVVDLGALPRRRDGWASVARDLRGTADYARYLDPRFRDAHYLRGRMAKALPPSLGVLTRIPTLPTGPLRILLRALLILERAIPSSPAIEDWIRSASPDLVLVTPLVTDASPQTEVVKSARAIGVRSALPVGSWDHLTTKGLIRVRPDLVLVWNEIQRDEAIELHGVPASEVVVTGAQPFDRWFERRPSTTREQFCQKVGLPPEKPFVLFAGSTASISAPEAEERFVRRWIEAIRHSENGSLREVGILVRPHPYNPGRWGEADLSDLGDAVVWPRGGANPVNEEDRAEYFDSLYHSAAVVGINTSAMIEAAIVGRPVFTIRTPEFADTQGGTLHFHYLLPEHGGVVRVAEGLEEHVRQLAESMGRAEAVQAEIRRFVGSFVRPHGLERPCTPIVVGVLERLAALGPRAPERTSPYLYLPRLLLWSARLPDERRRLAKRARKAWRKGPWRGSLRQLAGRLSLAKGPSRPASARLKQEQQPRMNRMSRRASQIAKGPLSPLIRAMRRILLEDVYTAMERQQKLQRELQQGQHKLLRELQGSVQRIEGAQNNSRQAIEKANVKRSRQLNHIEREVQACLRRLRLDGADLPYPQKLTAQRFRITSQNDEDGITLAIFEEAGVTNRRFVELGSGPNGGNSGFFALELGWTGLMVDAAEENIHKIRARFGTGDVTAVATWVTRENVNALLRQHGLVGEIDLLSIDLDGMDYWVWQALDVCSARVVIVEYNHMFGPDRAVTVPYQAQFDRHQTGDIAYYGASLAGLGHLATKKGYRLVTTEPRGVNAYFLRNDVAPQIPACDVRRAFREHETRVQRSVYESIERHKFPLVDVAETASGAPMFGGAAG